MPSPSNISGAILDSFLGQQLFYLCFISIQMLNESIHAEMYALQIEAYVTNPEEKDRLFTAIENISCINQKAQWVSKWLNGSQNLLTRLIGFGLVEGLFFAGSFCAIYYF